MGKNAIIFVEWNELITDDNKSTLTEAVMRRHSAKKVFPEISQNSEENTCERDSFFNKAEEDY